MHFENWQFLQHWKPEPAGKHRWCYINEGSGPSLSWLCQAQRELLLYVSTDPVYLLLRSDRLLCVCCLSGLRLHLICAGMVKRLESESVLWGPILFWPLDRRDCVCPSHLSVAYVCTEYVLINQGQIISIPVKKKYRKLPCETWNVAAHSSFLSWKRLFYAVVITSLQIHTLISSVLHVQSWRRFVGRTGELLQSSGYQWLSWSQRFT